MDNMYPTEASALIALAHTCNPSRIGNPSTVIPSRRTLAHIGAGQTKQRQDRLRPIVMVPP